MHYLYIIIDPIFSITVRTMPPSSNIQIGRQYFRQKATGEVVFYDWLADLDGNLGAIEIHLPLYHILLQTRTVLSKLPAVDTTDCYPRIVLFNRTFISPLGKEAFGDLFFFEDDLNQLAIAVGLDDWLTPTERERLLRELGV